MGAMILRNNSKDKTLFAIVTFYHPEDVHFTNLKKLATAPGIEGVIIVQNCDSPLPSHAFPNCTFIHNGNKGGIAGAFNKGAKAAFQKGADTIVLFDQDSKIPDDFVIKMLSFMEKHEAKIAASEFFDINSRSSGSHIKLHRTYFKKAPKNREFVKSNLVISSGCFISKAVFDKIGFFDEDLFIDHVDTDFNVRAYLSNFDIFVNREVVLNHAIGIRSKHRLFGLMTIKPTHHLPFRRYYYARNSFYLAKKYMFKSPIVVWLMFLNNVHDTLGILFYEDQKIAKIRATVRGIWHALIGKMHS